MPNPNRSIKPLGTITRGKTARNRLRQTDHFILLYDRSLISASSGGVVVDLGYGFEAVTTLEMADRFAKVNQDLTVVGVEIDPDRVENAKPFEMDRIRFRRGGFNVPLLQGETIRYMRAFNVLRQYSESEVIGAWHEMRKGMDEGGLLLEGTSTPSGGIWVANVLRARSGGWKKEGLVFYSNFHQPLDLNDFKAVLPKNYIHRMVSGEQIDQFFELWQIALNNTIGEKTYGSQAWYRASISELARLGAAVKLDKKLIGRGFLLVTDL